jgi:hypothetical protein
MPPPGTVSGAAPILNLNTILGVTGLPGGEYTLLIEDNYSSCSQTIVQTITDPSPDDSFIVGTTTANVCLGEEGEITLSDSEDNTIAPGVVYEVYKNGNPIGIFVNGTGGALSFIIPDTSLTALTTYNFSIHAVNGNCTPVFMTGSANITVNPNPVLSPGLDESVCSDEESGITFSTTVTSIAALNYNIVSITPQAGLTADAGNATAGVGKAANAILTDKFENITNGDLTVTYRVSPMSAAGCAGDTVNVVLTVHPEPELSPGLDDAVCSDEESGITLAVAAGSVAALNYNIVSITAQAGLTARPGNATAGAGKAANAIFNDLFENKTLIDRIVTYQVSPVSLGNCAGDTVDVILTVHPEPELSAGLDNDVCSDEESGITLSTTVTSIAVLNYNIVSITPQAGLTARAGNATAGAGKAANAIFNDLFENKTLIDRIVTYRISPVSAGGCAGDTVDVVLTIHPEPELTPGLSNDVCSDEESGITFSTTVTSIAAVNYNIVSITAQAGLTADAGNETAGVGKAANAILTDKFENPTNGDLTVTYQVSAVSAGGCAGDTVDVILTVHPEPELSAGLDDDVCSDEESGITLAVAAGSVAALNYNIVSITRQAGLTARPGNATTGAGKAANAIFNDLFENKTLIDRIVTYRISPVGLGNCAGDTVDVILTVHPEPELSAGLDDDVCSDEESGITLSTTVTSIAVLDYNIVSITAQGGLTARAGNATAGAGKAANAIFNDLFENKTLIDRIVTYRVSAVSAGGCAGDTVDVVLTIHPEPELTPGLDDDVCSDEESGITFSTTVTSIAALNYNIVSITAQAGLTADAGNETAGVGKAANAILTDKFENPTNGDLTVTYRVSAVSAGGCAGDTVDVILTVHPEPELSPGLDDAVCSDEESGITLSVAAGSVAALNYNIVSITRQAGLTARAGNATAGAGKAANAIFNDLFENKTLIDRIVTYRISPVGLGNCAGDTVDVVLTIHPEPELSAGLDNDVCSDEESGITFSTTVTSIAALNYNIVSITAQAGLTADAGNETAGVGKAANAILTDKFENPTNGDLTVTYRVSAVSAGGCAGDTVDVILTVHPEPELSPGLDDAVCSDEESGITLSVAAGSVAALNYNIVSITRQAGLTARAGNATAGAGKAANAIFNDLFENKTLIDRIVTYQVSPISLGNCAGDTVDVILTVHPEPELSAGLDNDVCSDEESGITLSTTVTSIAVLNYNIVSITPQAGLTARAGNATAGAGKAANAIFNDLFENKTLIDRIVTYRVSAVSAGGCAGDTVDVVLTIHPEPELTAGLSNDVCSDEESGITFSTTVTSIAAVNYNIVSITAQAGLTADAGNETAGVGKAANAILTDKFENPTNGDLTVTYRVSAVSAGGCAGDTVNVILTVHPEPELSAGLDDNVCSDEESGITLAVAAGSVAALNYNIVSITRQAGLTARAGNATTGAGKAANAIFNDLFENKTLIDRIVTYRISPVGLGNCAGDTVDVILTVHPEPELSAGLDDDVCSDEESGITFSTTVTSIAALNYNIVSITAQGGLTARAGNATAGAGKAANAIFNDLFENKTLIDRIVTYRVSAVSAGGCAGDTVDVVLTIHPEPELTPGLDDDVCSDEESGITFSTTVTSIAALNYNIVSITAQAGLTADAGNETAGVGKAANAILTDRFENPTNGDLTVTYRVSAVSAGGCAGDTVDVILTVHPEPELSPGLDDAVCSDEESGITLSVAAGSVAALNYNIVSITRQAGLTARAGNATAGAGKAANAIFNDLFENKTLIDRIVTYRISPVGLGNCAGDTVDVVLTIHPEPELSAGLDNDVCSDEESGITFSTTVTSIAALNYNIVSITAQAGLTADAGNETAGVGKAANAILTDKFENLTNGDLTVTYRVSPMSAAGCAGDTVNVVLTVHPEPELSAGLDDDVCSDEESGITLAVAAGSVAALNYNIVSITAQAGLTARPGNATAGAGKAANAIFNDLFENKTLIDRIVTYQVSPVSLGNCAGDTVDVILTVHPEPELSAGLDNDVCSDEESGITLSTTVTSIAVLNYNIVSITPQAGLTARAGNATAGAGKAANAIFNDLFENKTLIDRIVTYRISPVSAGGCAGDTVDVVLTIHPESELTAGLSNDVCSDEESGITFSTTVTSIAAVNYNIVSITAQAGLTADAGNETAGVGKAANAILTDKFKNLTNGDLTVTYRVSAVSAGGCAGDTVNVVLTVHPQPVLASGLDDTVCTDEDSEITLSVAAGSVAALNYNIVNITAQAGLTPRPGNETAGAGKAANAIFNDRFVNNTTTDLTVTYRISAVSSANCAGDTVDVILTVSPEAIAFAGDDATICASTPYELEDATIGGIANTGAWSIYTQPPLGDGVLSSTAQLADPSVVTFAASVAGVYQLILLTDNPPGGCIAASDTVKITVTDPPVLVTPQSKIICGNDNVSYEILLAPANIPANTRFNWADPDGAGPATAGVNVPAGVAGTNHINDILTNNSASNINVIYRVVPYIGSCVGDTTDITITVRPTPSIVVNQDKTICSGENVNLEILLSPANTPPGTTFSWPDPDGPGSATSRVNVLTSDIPQIKDKLFNNSTSDILVRYTIKARTATCTSPNTDIDIIVNPGAVTVAGADKISCPEDRVVLAGADIAGLVTSGTWSIFSLPTAGDGVLGFTLITDRPDTVSFIASVAGDYILRLTSQDPAGGCPAVTDEVTITVLDENNLLCKGGSGGPGNVNCLAFIGNYTIILLLYVLHVLATMEVCQLLRI